mgnify:CR=1 FL=1
MTGPEFDQFERIADAQERQAEALELMAGMMMLRLYYDDDAVDFTAEAMEEEARFFARGGGL